MRETTGAGVMEAKKALEAAKGNEAKAKIILVKMGLEKIAKRQDKEAAEGQIFAYAHNNGRVASLVKLLCETDFVGRSQDFQTLGKELAMQVASMEPDSVQTLLAQKYIRDSAKTINDLINAVSAKCKEKILVQQIARMSLWC